MRGKTLNKVMATNLLIDLSGSMSVAQYWTGLASTLPV